MRLDAERAEERDVPRRRAYRVVYRDGRHALPLRRILSLGVLFLFLGVLIGNRRRARVFVARFVRSALGFRLELGSLDPLLLFTPFLLLLCFAHRDHSLLREFRGALQFRRALCGGFVEVVRRECFDTSGERLGRVKVRRHETHRARAQVLVGGHRTLQRDLQALRADHGTVFDERADGLECHG